MSLPHAGATSKSWPHLGSGLWSEALAGLTPQVVAVVATLLVSHAASAQFVQQGPKLVGTGVAGPPGFGYGDYQGGSVGISRDGNTAIMGGPGDDWSFAHPATGAAWIFARNAGVWSQQGAKLVGTGAVGYAEQGGAVAVSGDGDTVIVGGLADDMTSDLSAAGAAWIFTRTGSVWSQQGAKLVGAGATGRASQGVSVAISGDGNTAIVGGPSDNGPVDGTFAGAAWVFTRIGGIWSQQGAKLVGTGAIGNAEQGLSVAISADGNTAIVGGPFDNKSADGSAVGAAWVFTRIGGIWSQQGAKLVGAGAAGNAYQGYSVAISGDGTTAIVGGPEDDGHKGAAWVFTRNAGSWNQGQKLVGTGAIAWAQLGVSVALSENGNTAVIGGPEKGTDFVAVGTGGAWVFERNNGVWSQGGGKLDGDKEKSEQGRSVAISGYGSTIIVGAPYDGDINAQPGAAWVYARSPASQGNYQGMWWKADESGWGVNFAHQGDQIFATWYTYDTSGNAYWLSMLGRSHYADNAYHGDVYVDVGPPFNNFTGSGTALKVGDGTITFSDANTGTFAYNLNLGTGGATAAISQIEADHAFRARWRRAARLHVPERAGPHGRDELPGPVVAAKRIGLGRELRASGEPDVRHLVHVRREVRWHQLSAVAHGATVAAGDVERVHRARCIARRGRASTTTRRATWCSRRRWSATRR